jgi:hypothetical protein
LSTKIGVARVAGRISLHLISVIRYTRQALSGIEIKDYRMSGVGLGSLTKLALNYSTI